MQNQPYQISVGQPTFYTSAGGYQVGRCSPHSGEWPSDNPYGANSMASSLAIRGFDVIFGTEYDDAATVVVALTPSSVESADFGDTATVGLAITPSSVDTLQAVDTGTVVVALSPSASETAQAVESATVPVTITPSAVESQVHILKANTFEGGSNGVAITTGNSGGASGDAFQAIGGTLGTFSTAAAMQQAMGLRVAYANGVAGSGACFWQGLGSFTTDVFLRMYFRVDALPTSVGGVVLCRYLDASSGTCAGVKLLASGKFQNHNASGGVIGSPSTTVISLNTVYRLEMRVTPSTTNGNMESRLFLGDSLTPIESIASGASQVFTANIDEARLGTPNTTTQTADTNFDFDGFAVATGDWIGPFVVVPISYSDAATVNLAITPSSADTAQYVDAATAALAITPSASDVAQYADVATVNLALTASAAEVGIIHTDAATVTLAITPSSADTEQMVEAGTVTVGIVPSAADTAQDVDAATARVTVTPSSADTAQFVDATTPVVAITPSFADTAQYVDSATAVVSITPSVADTAQYVDSATARMTITPSSADTAQFVDAATALVALTPSAVEVGIIHTDAATAIVTITPSTSEVYVPVITDAGTAVVAITPSASDVAQYVDAATAVVVLTPSAALVQGVSDSGTATIGITPSSTDVIGKELLDDTEVDLVITPATLVENQVPSDAAVVPVSITPFTLSEFQGDGDIVPLKLTASVTEQRFYDDSGLVLVTIGVDATETTSLTTASTVPVTIMPDSEDVFAGLDAAVVGLLITPGAVVELRQVADYLLVGILSNHYVSVLRGDSYIVALSPTRYIVSGFEAAWQTIWHGRGDE
jgi:hypothetical protein